MESAISLLYENAEHAHLIIFGLLILAGFNVPISEDLMLITAGVIASTILPDHTIKLFLWTFAGAYLSDWIAYWLGRSLGPELRRIRWFRKTIKLKRIAQITRFYRKYGFSTLLVGRFIPFGVRNVLFITAGMGRMNFLKFILSDGVACIISTSTVFTIAYSCGKNHDLLFAYMKQFQLAVFSVAMLAFASGVVYWKFRKPAEEEAGQA